MAVNMKQFSVDLLHALHAPVTHANVAALVGWQAAEGGAVHNNPFNTTQGAPGATSMNSVGVKTYTGYNEALHATVETLNNGYYGKIISALKQSNPNAFVAAVGSSPWGTSGETLSSTVRDALGTNYGLAATPAVAAVAKSRARGGSPAVPGKTTSKTITDPGVTTKTTTGGGLDVKGALVNALLQSTPINESGALPSGSSSLLSKLMANIGSGAFTTPVVNTTSKSGSTSATLKTVAQGKAASQGGAVKSQAPGKMVSGIGVLDKNGNPINPDGKVVDLHLAKVVTAKAPWNPAGKPLAAWIVPILQYAWNHGWRGSVNSGYRSDAEQTAIYNSGVRPAAVPKSEGGSGSNHEGDAFPQGAVDINGAQQLSDILQKSPYANILVYAGSKDPVHFSHPHDGGY